jgi:Spy/CpxP family protein refolding chaperone
MSTIKTLAIAAALAISASSLAMAQQSGSPAGNAAASGGPGTHQGAEKTGSASNKEKVEKNQNGYQGGHQ